MSHHAEDARDRKGDIVINVLDHGYVGLIESWGSDEMIVESARMSTSKSFNGWGPKCSRCGHSEEEILRGLGQSVCGSLNGHDIKAGDEKLLRFLYDNKHSTPFEFAGMTIEVMAPIVVFREWMRHRTQSYSEVSARYTPLPFVDYIPSIERLMMQGGANKQAASTGAALTAEDAEKFRASIAYTYAALEGGYQEALAMGVPKELARLILPVGRYSKMRASTDLRNWIAFLTLREAPDAQWEIRQYAHAVSALIKEKFPRTHALYVEGARRG